MGLLPGPALGLAYLHLRLTYFIGSVHINTIIHISGYRRPFSWPAYLQETASRAVPASAFKAVHNLVPLHTAFKKGTKVEVVDRRNPILVRVATIADVLCRQIKVSGAVGTGHYLWAQFVNEACSN